MISCYYQVFVEVPRPTAAKKRHTARARARATGRAI